MVAETMSGVVLIGKRGGKRFLVPDAAGASGVTSRRGKVYTVIGGPDENGKPPAGKYAATSVLRTNVRTGRTVAIANLSSYELAHNPDHQKQFNAQHQPYDALSNPFSVTHYPRGLLVADGGANDVLRVNPRTGKVSTFFVPPTVKPQRCRPAEDRRLRATRAPWAATRSPRASPTPGAVSGCSRSAPSPPVVAASTS